MNILFTKNMFDNHLDPHGRVLIFREKEIREYSYTLNSDGVRSIDFYDKPEVVALGCSITMGVGLKDNDFWPNILQKKIGNKIKVGNISYCGGSAMKIIISFFKMIDKYQYFPKYVFCNFPPLSRFLFLSSNNNYLTDYFSTLHPIKDTKAYAPFDYNKIIAHEWAYYINLEYIKMLEIFCKNNGIKLIWSTWSKNDSKLDNFSFFDHFESYRQDPTIDIFPAIHEDIFNFKDINQLVRGYSILDPNSECHKEEERLYGKYYFNCAYDNKKQPDNTFTPHPGVHRHLHWAEFYEQFIDNDDRGII